MALRQMVMMFDQRGGQSCQTEGDCVIGGDWIARLLSEGKIDINTRGLSSGSSEDIIKRIEGTVYYPYPTKEIAPDFLELLKKAFVPPKSDLGSEGLVPVVVGQLSGYPHSDDKALSNFLRQMPAVANQPNPPSEQEIGDLQKQAVQLFRVLEVLINLHYQESSEQERNQAVFKLLSAVRVEVKNSKKVRTLPTFAWVPAILAERLIKSNHGAYVDRNGIHVSEVSLRDKFKKLHVHAALNAKQFVGVVRGPISIEAPNRDKKPEFSIVHLRGSRETVLQAPNINDNNNKVVFNRFSTGSRVISHSGWPSPQEMSAPFEISSDCFPESVGDKEEMFIRVIIAVLEILNPSLTSCEVVEQASQQVRILKSGTTISASYSLRLEAMLRELCYGHFYMTENGVYFFESSPKKLDIQAEGAAKTMIKFTRQGPTKDRGSVVEVSAGEFVSPPPYEAFVNQGVQSGDGDASLRASAPAFHPRLSAAAPPFTPATPPLSKLRVTAAPFVPAGAPSRSEAREDSLTAPAPVAAPPQGKGAAKNLADLLRGND